MELHLLVSELKKDKAITSSMFSLYLADRFDESKIQFGGYDQSIVDASIQANKANLKNVDSSQVSESSDGIYWMDINSKYHW